MVQETTIYLPGIERVPAYVRAAVRRFALRVVEHGGAAVHSLALYGPVAGPGFEAGGAAIQSVVVLNAVELSVLRRLAEEGHHFGRDRIAAPLVLTPGFIRASLDTYPLELLEIQQQHIMVLGEDLFAPLKFDDAHVRLQAERELKVIALAMRQSAVTVGSEEEWLRVAARPALEDLGRVLRGVLWLKGKREPLPAADMLREVETLLGQPLPGVRGILDARGKWDWLEFERLYQDVEALEKFADAR